MVSTVLDNAMSSTNIPVTQQSRPVLRRATYVHVSDLTSPYNIDHAKLEEEVARVKAEFETTANPTTTTTQDLSEPEIDPNSAATELDTALAAIPQKRLQPPRGGYNLCVLVGKVTIVVDKRRVDQSRVRLAEVEIGDETGTVSLRARDEQIDLLMEVSERSGAIVLRNCTLELYQGKHIRLAVTKWGKLSVYPDAVASTPPPPSKMNFDRNFSRIDLSVVASEMVDPQPELAYANRPTKGSDTVDNPSKSGPSKGSQGFARNQNQPSTRRGGRDRRQQKAKQGPSGAPMPSMYTNLSGDPNSFGTQPNAMRFQGMHPYPVYEQGMEMRQYSYGHRRHQQDPVLPPASAQQMMMQRQYEMQQQQLQHMYHGRQDHYRGVSQNQPPGLLPQQLIPAASFDASEYQMPSYTPTGSSPILIPINMASTPSSQNSATRAPNREDRPTEAMDTAPTGQERDSQPNQYMSVSPDDSQLSQGKMNPDATAFAPAFANQQGTAAPGSHVYFSYDHSHTGNTNLYPSHGHHPAVYPSGAMYAPSAGSSVSNPKNPGSSADNARGAQPDNEQARSGTPRSG